MRFGAYRAGQQAETFLRRRLAWGPVAVAQLEAVAGQERIPRATLYRTARRLGVGRMSTEAGRLWALPAEPVPAESERQAVAVESDVAQVAEPDHRLERAVAAARRLMARGQRTSSIIHRIRKAWGAELADQVKAALDAELENEMRQVSKLT